jgi:nucleoside-diphosphate-sugar epimerase
MNNDYGENREITYDDPQPADIRYIKEEGFEPQYTLEQGLRITRDRLSKDLEVVVFGDEQ